MDFQEYQHLTLRTNTHHQIRTGQIPATYDEQIKAWRDQITNAAMGISGEGGEVIDAMKKLMYHDHDIDEIRAKVKEELGDLMWYMASCAAAFDIGLESVADANIEKLRKRYPDSTRKGAGTDDANNHSTATNNP